MRTRNVLVGAVAVAGAVALASPSQAFVKFNPKGTGGKFGQVLERFDWQPGNTLAIGAQTAVENKFLNDIDGGARDVDFATSYQAELGTFNFVGGPQEQFGDAAMNPNQNLTVVMGFTDRVAVSTLSPIRLAQFEFVDTNVDFIEIYLQESPNDANNFQGTNFNSGRLILKADMTGLDQATFIINDATPVDLDQFGGNNYPGQLTVQGASTVATATGEIMYVDPAYMQVVNQGPQTPDFNITMLTDIGLRDPFITVNPGQQFVGAMNDFTNILPGGFGAGPAPVVGGPTPAAGTFGSIGEVNGDSTPAFFALTGAGEGRGGPDLIFQTDTSQVFDSAFIPEPLSATLGMMGLGALGLVTRRRQMA